MSIARALSTDPTLLLLDEPLSALDEVLRLELGELLQSVVAGRGVTALMVTHNLNEAVLLSHRVAVMHRGRVRHEIDNPLPHPRAFDGKLSDDAVGLRNQLADALLNEG